MQYNAVLNVSHYAALGNGTPLVNRKQWETAMARRTLEDFGVMRPDAWVLGVGAGRERLIYELSARVAWVFATDIYLAPGRWNEWHDATMLISPAAHAGVFAADVAYNDQRIIPLHMDGRRLRFPDDTFDGVFSSGSIEHFGEQELFPQWDAVEQAAAEIGRVLKPGGIASLSTEYKIAGGGWGFDIVRCLDADDLMRYIVEPSGLDLVDALETTISAETLATRWHMHDPQAPAVEAAVTYDEYTFTSVHLALRKPA
jgi:SAM-dependent methyltransferase